MSRGSVVSWCIYVLKNPRTNEIRYVGWTSRSPVRRLNLHISGAIRNQRGGTRNYKDRWVLSLLAIGLKPVMEVVETGVGADTWPEAERRWIAKFRSEGARLVNQSEGGEGNPGYVFSEDARRRISEANKGRSLTPEHRKKLTAAAIVANTGKVHRPEVVAARAAKLKGIPRPPEVITKWHAGLKDRVYTPEVREKMAAAKRGSKLSEETRRKMSEAQKRRPPITEEARASMVAAQRARKLPAEVMARYAERMKNIRPSAEDMRRAGETRRGRKARPEEAQKRLATISGWSEERHAEMRKKISDATRGRVVSAESRAKMSASRIRMLAERRNSAVAQ